MIVVSARVPRTTMIRRRSSSRCSTTVAPSPCGRRWGNIESLDLGLALAGHRDARLNGCRQLGGLGRVPAHGVFELAHPRTERSPDFRKALRTEEQQRD